MRLIDCLKKERGFICREKNISQQTYLKVRVCVCVCEGSVDNAPLFFANKLKQNVPFEFETFQFPASKIIKSKQVCFIQRPSVSAYWCHFFGVFLGKHQLVSQYLHFQRDVNFNSLI